MRRLTILSGLAKGAVFDLSGRQVLIGRADENDIVLEDTDVSRRHVVLVLDGTEYRVRDLGAINGVRINGKSTSDGKLSPGDSLDIGLVQAKYDAVASTPPAAAATVAPQPATVVRKSEYELQLDSLSQLNRELNLQLVRARQDLQKAPDQALAPPAAEVVRLKEELAAARGDVEKARQSVTKIEELTVRNQELSAQVTAREQALVAVRQEGEARLQRELQLVNTNLAQAQAEVAQVRRDAAERVARESAERVRIVAELQQVHVERERLGQELTQTHTRLQEVATELTMARSELDQVRSGSARLDEVLRDRHQLQAQFEAFRQQTVTERQQLESTARAEISQLQRDLELARKEVELHAKKATAKITVAPPAPTAELQRVRGELDQTRAQLEAARRTAERVEQLTKENQDLAATLASTQQAITSLRAREASGVEPAVVERLQSELAASRAELQRLTERAVTPHPPSGPAFSIRPPTTRTAAPPAQSPPSAAEALAVPPVPSEAGHLVKVVGAFLVAAAVGGGAIWYFNREPERHLPYGQKLGPVDNRVILEPAPTHLSTNPPVAPPAATTPPVAPPPTPPVVPPAPSVLPPPASPPTLSPSAAPKTSALTNQRSAPAVIRELPEVAGQYQDPAGRFTCLPPTGWKTIAENQTDISRVRFTQGRDEVVVIVTGTTYPDLRPEDAPKLRENMVAQFRLRHPSAYADIQGTDWQPAADGLGFQMDLTVTMDGEAGWVRVMEYCSRGRECTIELFVRSLKQQPLLEAVFLGFLTDFHVLPAKGGS